MTRLYYHRLPEFARKEEKLDFLSDRSLSDVDWCRLVPNAKHTWLRTDTEDEFAAYLPIGSKKAKAVKDGKAETIFKRYGRGVATSKDYYVFGFRFEVLTDRMRKFIDNYNSEVDRYCRSASNANVDEFVNYELLKWDGTLKADLAQGRYGRFKRKSVRNSLYRPFTRKHLYFDRLVINSVYLQPYFFPNLDSEYENHAICVSGTGHDVFRILITDNVCELKFSNSANGGTQAFPFYTYDEDGSNRRENITDYARDLFRSHYHDPAISKWDIFYYVYGILHHPGYRQRYALDLKRNLPRIPFASAFRPYADVGEQLAELHLNYEAADRCELDWQSTRNPVSYRVEKMLPKGKVDAADGNYKVYNTLKYNDALTLCGIPERAFAYRLGNRSALDWIVDQYRVKTDRRSGITHDPNGYSDDPQYILKLIERVITVSLRTVDIVGELAKLPFREESAAD